MNQSLLWICLCFGLLVSACSGPGASSERDANSSLRFNLGTSARVHIVVTAEDAFLTRYGYRLNRQVNTAEDVRIETSWRDVTPSADEQAAGYSEVRVRVFMSARPRSRAGGMASTFTARMEVECEARIMAGGDWQPVSITEEREAYFQEIADFLENEFKAGVM